jgi:hypothetical protein
MDFFELEAGQSLTSAATENDLLARTGYFSHCIDESAK